MVDGKDVNSVSVFASEEWHITCALSNLSSSPKCLFQITFVGRIVSVQEQASRIAMKVHDGTGLMDVTSWVNDSEPETVSGCMLAAWSCAVLMSSASQLKLWNTILQLARQREELQVGRYVRVYGNLKRFGNTISVTCYTVRPVSDYNDVGVGCNDVCLEAVVASICIRRVPVACASWHPCCVHQHCTGCRPLLSCCCLPCTQITYQNLQVIYQHLHITRGQAPPMASMQPAPTHMQQHQQQQQVGKTTGLHTWTPSR